MRAANELAKQGHVISPGGVRNVWLRHDLQTMKKRLAALEAKVAQEGGVLTDAHLTTLERGRREQEAYGNLKVNAPATAGHKTRSMSAR